MKLSLFVDAMSCIRQDSESHETRQKTSYVNVVPWACIIRHWKNKHVRKAIKFCAWELLESRRHIATKEGKHFSTYTWGLCRSSTTLYWWPVTHLGAVLKHVITEYARLDLVVWFEIIRCWRDWFVWHATNACMKQIRLIALDIARCLILFVVQEMPSLLHNHRKLRKPFTNQRPSNCSQSSLLRIIGEVFHWKGNLCPIPNQVWLVPGWQWLSRTALDVEQFCTAMFRMCHTEQLYW